MGWRPVAFIILNFMLWFILFLYLDRQVDLNQNIKIKITLYFLGYKSIFLNIFYHDFNDAQHWILCHDFFSFITTHIIWNLFINSFYILFSGPFLLYSSYLSNIFLLYLINRLYLIHIYIYIIHLIYIILFYI